MATVQGTTQHPAEQLFPVLQHAATQLKYRYDPTKSRPGVWAFVRDASLWSWGSQINVTVQPVSPTQTQLTAQTYEKMAIWDWGRGKRAATRLLNAAGATVAP
ncbi:MAG: hypothetical protein QM733_02685 [Ilumatobacteraceae bacterium]